MGELKPCPFCGGEGTRRRAMGESWIACRVCGASTMLVPTDGAAAALWNTRHNPSGEEAQNSGGWRPIESAPRDGTIILLGHDQAVFDGWWDPDNEGGCWVDGATSGYNDDLIVYYPTHWQPLPDPPSSLTPTPQSEAKPSASVAAPDEPKDPSPKPSGGGEP